MNQATEIELKKIVERVARPIPAGIDRKKQMRAELLAHVHTAFEEELARGVDENAALQQTRARFGDPEKLAAEIGGTLSRPDRLAFLLDRLAQRRMGESAWRCSARRALYIFAAHYAMFLFVVLPFVLMKPPRLAVWRGTYFVLCLATAVSSAVFVGSLLTIVIRHSLFRAARARAARFAAACLLTMMLVPICEFSLFLAVSGDLGASIRGALWALPFVVLLPTGLSLLAWAIEREERYKSEWASLNLD
jgi:ATP-dependent Clp protease ATP-binding subunit ClpC